MALRPLSRRGFLGAAAGSVLPAQSAARPLNVVFILADDLGARDLGIDGADLHETPNLDRLARSSVRFTQAYAAAPVCSPTRASIQTGKYPARLRMTIWREASANPPRNRRMIPPVVEGNLPHGEVTIAERLRERGYFNAHVGKWHLGEAGYFPETQGFDLNIGGTHWGAPQSFFYPYRGTKHFGGEPRYVPHLAWGEPGEYLTDRLTSEALKIVERAQGRPFFLNLWYHTVHTPIEAKERIVERYRAKLRPGLNHQNATYAAMVHSLDENAGRLLDGLEKAGVAGNTLVIFTSDNGGFIGNFDGRTVTSNAPLRSGKGSLYEGGIRVPLFIRWPGVTPAGAVCGEPVISNDFHATIAEVAGLGGVSGTDGESLVPLLKSPAARLAREELFFHYPHYYATTTPVSAVRAREWKLLEYHEDGRIELYQLERDPGERRDLAREIPAKAQELLGKLRRWRASVRAPMPLPNPDWR